MLSLSDICFIVFIAEYVLSLGAMSEEKFKEAITDQYSDLYWDEDLLHDMYEAVTGGEQSRRFVTHTPLLETVYKISIVSLHSTTLMKGPRLVLKYDT